MATRTSASRINVFLQEKLASEDLPEVAAAMAVEWLVEGGLLDASAARPARPFQDMLRGGEIVGAIQRPPGAKGIWSIVRTQPPSPEGDAPAPSGAAALPQVWRQLNDQPRHSIRSLKAEAATIPAGPGVYAFFRDGRPVYLGRATGSEGLRRRLTWTDTLSGQSLRESTFRSNVAQGMGFGRAEELVNGSVRLTPTQMGRLDGWINGCSVAWVACETEQQAIDLARKLKATRRPTRV